MKVLALICATLVLAALTIASPGRRGKHTDDFQTYWDYHKMEHYFEDIAEEHDFVHLEEIGTTSQGHKIHAIRVSVPSPNHPEPEPDHHHHKPMIMIESGLHAREWIAPMAHLYVIHMLVEHYPLHKDLMEKVDFLFVPMANPDGYEFSRTEGNRLWNKNRRRVSQGCYGVDLNRNFDFHFEPSNDACDEHYAGITAGSEAETRAIQDTIEKYRDQIQIYLSLQAPGQQILTPYNYAPEVGENHEEHMALGNEVAAVIKAYLGKDYVCGDGGHLLEHPESGTSSDYAYGSKKVHLAYTMKLPAGGESGFEVPESQLDEILWETFYGILVFIKHLANQPVPY